MLRRKEIKEIQNVAAIGVKKKIETQIETRIENSKKREIKVQIGKGK